MKTLKFLSTFFGAIATLVILGGFVHIVLELNASWMTWTFLIALFAWVLTEGTRTVIIVYRRKIKPVIESVNDVMSTSAEFTEDKNKTL